LLGLVLIREWITQHDWTQNMNQEPEQLEEIVPDDWVIQRGIALKWDELFTSQPVRLASTDRPTNRLGPMSSVSVAEQHDGKLESSSSGEILDTTNTSGASHLSNMSNTPDVPITTNASIVSNTPSQSGPADERTDAENGGVFDLGGDNEAFEAYSRGVSAQVPITAPNLVFSATDRELEGAKTVTEAEANDDFLEAVGSPPKMVPAFSVNPRPGGPSQIDVAFTAPEMLHQRETIFHIAATDPAANDLRVRELLHAREDPTPAYEAQRDLDWEDEVDTDQDDINQLDVPQLPPQALAPLPPVPHHQHVGGPDNAVDWDQEDLENANLDREDWDGILEGEIILQGCGQPD